MYDVIEKLGSSTIQHGKNNKRIYLQKLSKTDYPEIIKDLEKLAKQKSYTKIFAKIPDWALDNFKEKGFVEEAKIPNFYNDNNDAHFMAKFLDDKRKKISAEKKTVIEQNIKIAKKKKPAKIDKNIKPFSIRLLKPTDVSKLVNLYKLVFDSYPFPIFEPEYIKKTMEEHIKYFGVFNKEQLIAASSAELDIKAQNCEMTDFATNPKFRGNGLAKYLLAEMEKKVKEMDIKTLYTIARSHSAGMNITFSKLDYNYSGTLINNTNISGNIESMNVWFKHLN